MGVKRALEMVLNQALKGRREIVTYGPLIHNPQVVELLASRGIRSRRNIEDITPGKVGFISAHGISPEAKKRLMDTGAVICDASCPDVIKVQGIIRKHARGGFATVIFGDKGHTEVEGLLGFAEGRGYVVGSVEEVKNLPVLDKVCLVSQTTQGEDEYNRVAQAVRERFPDARVFPTICTSTRERQSELLEMTRKVDTVVIVGGRNSANTARLTRIAQAQHIPVFQVETAEELDLGKIGAYRTVGVTAGASTPNWLIQGVVDRLQDWSWKQKIAPLRWAYTLLTTMVKSNLFIALGGACLTFAAMRLLGLPVNWQPILLSFSAVLAIYNLNIFADQPAILLNQPSRYRFFQRYRKLLLFVCPSALLLAFYCGTLLGLNSFLLAVFALILGLAYTFKVFPSSWPWRRLKDVPGSKELFNSLGWGTLAVLIPAFSTSTPNPPPRAITVAFAFVFIVIFVRSTLLGIRDMQGDRLVGRETIPVMLGKEKTKVLLGAITSLLALLLILATTRGWVPPFGYYYLGVIAYAYLYLFLYHKRILFQGLFHEMIVDSGLILSGIIAWLVS